MKNKVLLLIILFFILPVFAVECPPGFHWERMSGVGCVQDDCAAKGGGYTYTKECWCGDNVRACYGAVNYSGFDAKKCSSFCPISKFIGCADANGKCPNDKPTQPGCQYHNPDCAEGYQCTNNVCSPTQEYCNDYCIKMEGPHATATIQNNICQCGCEEGYTNENSDVLLCQPTKATCDAYCKSYHGGDKNHGDSSYGTVMGTDCDCHCNKGYVPDNTLTCIKAANCQDECLKKMGEGANGSGTYPNCNCDCQKGYTKHYIYGNEWKLVCKKVECPKNSTFDYSKGECVCDKGFYPTPKDGVCIKQITKETCGNNHCDIEPKEGAVIEDCEFCPQDCKCKADEVCDVNNPAKTIENMGCIKAVAQLVEIGCADGRELPPIAVVREGTQKEIEAHVGMQLVEGDEVRMNGLTTKDCNRPYVTIQWGNVRGRLMLGQLKMYALTIKKDAIESGWPEITTREVGWTAWEVISTTLIESTPLHVAQLLLFTTATGTGEQDAVKVYVKSHILINQTSSGINIYTLEGNPTVEYKGKNTTLDKSMKVTVNKDGVSTPANFTAGEVGDWFLRIPSPPGEENANANGGGNTMPDLSGITSQLKNTCCGSTAMIGMLLVLAAWSGRKHSEK